MTFKPHQNTSQYKKGNPTENHKQKKFTPWTDENTAQHPKPQNHLTDVASAKQPNPLPKLQQHTKPNTALLSFLFREEKSKVTHRTCS